MSKKSTYGNFSPSEPRMVQARRRRPKGMDLRGQDEKSRRLPVAPDGDFTRYPGSVRLNGVR